jgi:hypothetical protein
MMSNRISRKIAIASFFVTLLSVLSLFNMRNNAHAEGEASNGFPNWSERVLLEWINRARSDPQADLAACPTGNCPDKACYTPIKPLHFDPNLAHSARFHSSHMMINDYFDHYSHCTLFSNIPALYLSSPQTCNGAAACSCVGGAITTDSAAWTHPFVRISMFGSNASGEIIVQDSSGINNEFYDWLYEATSSSVCQGDNANGHRWLILTTAAGVGIGLGTSGSYSTGDFGGGSTNALMPSGSHYPQQAASVAAWTNWSSSAGPSVAKINVDGVCQDMTISRGSSSNGAWTSTVTGVGTGCHRYFFAFKDSAGKQVFYPSNGSLAIGSGASCPDWSSVKPADCSGFDRIFLGVFEQ